MPSGRPRKPAISIDSLKAALAMLGVGAATESQTLALRHLALVEQVLARPGRPSAEDLRAWALMSMLADLLAECLTIHRHYFDLPAANPNESLADAIASISADARTGSSDLIGYSHLYYRYVRPELAISAANFADLCAIQARTLRRYQTEALRKFRDELIAREWQARQDNHQLTLAAVLPQLAVPFINRDNLLDQLHSAFEAGHRHYTLLGEAGIGKTALAGGFCSPTS